MKLGVYCANETLSRYFDGVSLANNGIEHKTDSKASNPTALSQKTNILVHTHVHVPVYNIHVHVIYMYVILPDSSG